ncbi:hypothetical protein NSA36_11755 [Anaerotruncus colihominis]|nr:hypothetical protein [Anaerotruncus colihominis]
MTDAARLAWLLQAPAFLKKGMPKNFPAFLKKGLGKKLSSAVPRIVGLALRN